MAKTYRVGIAGVVHGHVGTQVRSWGETAQAEVVAIADANRDERARLVQRYELDGARSYNTIGEMLATEELDIISVCTTTAAHAEVVEIAAARGVHSVVEKPLAVRLADADRMVAAAGKYGVQIVTNYPIRWNRSAYSQAVRFVQEGGIGRPYEVRHRGGGPKPRVIDADPFFAWLYQPRFNGAGAFADYTCYGADLACDVLGAPASVYALAGRWVRTDLIGDDNARMILQYPQGVGMIEATWTQFGNLPASTFFAGEAGTLAIHGDALTLYSADHPRGRPLTDLPPLVEEPTAMAHLVRCLEEGIPVATWAGIAAQRLVTEVMDAGLRSVETGAAVRLPLPLPHLRG